MKTKFYLLLLCAASFVFFGCENQKNDPQDQGTGISCTPSAIDAPLSGGTYTITVTSTSAWAASCNRSWVTLDSKSGQGDAYVQLTIAKGEKDSANVIFLTGAGTAIVKIGRGVKASQDDNKPSNGDYGKAPANAIAVDLGLSVKWANMNVGATKPEEYGNYYAWGEVTPKDYYDWSTYKYCTGGFYSMTKYCTDSDYGTVDNKTVLEKSDDAASYNWGGDWRMPTLEEIKELQTKCTSEWTTNYNGTGVAGRIVTGPNGNSIFLPAAGCRYKSDLYDAGSYGDYWSSSLFEFDSGSACYLYFISDYCDWLSIYRYDGLSVRPVTGDSTPISSEPSVTTALATEITFNSAIVGGTVISDGGASVTARGICYSTNANPTISNSKVTNGSGTGSFSCSLTSLSENTTYYARAYATNSVGTSYGEQISFRTTIQQPTGLPQNVQIVDLGLSVKWANMNVGATKPEEYGNYYAWGEVTPKDNYDWSTYKYCNGSDDFMTKYCTDSDYGTVDNKTVLEKSDDAASYNWGGDWRMPTLEEIKELQTKCTSEWTSNYNGNGVAGRIVTGPNGNSIFLPAAGCRREGGLSNAGSRGYYWSSALDEGYSYNACTLGFISDYSDWGYDDRYYGLSVRPVLK